jgi:redox-sensitive bicupin YhaK (pirin superfamily)
MATLETATNRPGAIEVIRSNERGHFDHGWLDTYHTFSFGDYYDPRRMGFRSLRVINEDRVAPSHGFGTHPHRDMEIITYVLEGTLLHGDSMGHGGPIRAGEMQRITAGTGITHSERNASANEEVHFYQIWILPDRKNHQPSYEQKTFDPAGRQGRWQLVASNDGRDGSLTIHQDASLWLARVASGEAIDRIFPGDRQGWLQVVRGQVQLDGITLEPGDGAIIPGGRSLAIQGINDAEVLLFDLA